MRKLTLCLLGAAASAALLSTPALAGEDGDDIYIPYSVYEADQEQYGDIHSTITLEIEDYSAAAVSNSVALGNSATGHVKSGDMDSDITQVLHGDVLADNGIYGGSSGHVVATTTAYGNSASGGTWDGNNYFYADQTATGDVEAHTQVDMDGAYAIATGTSAIANVSSSSDEYGDNRAFQSQDSQGSVVATTDVDLCCDGDAAVFTTTAGANAVSVEGSSTTSFTGAVQTTAEGEHVVASSDVYIWDGHNVHSATTAFGNSATVHNEWGYATLGRDGSELYQENSSDIVSETYVTLDHWSGTATTTAYGLGNSALISNVGSDTGLYAQQQNNGNVIAHVDFAGQAWTGGAGVSTATAIGNAATATLCNYCGDASVQGSVHQVNNGNVTASTYVSAPHSGGIHASAAAVGNSSTFTSTGK